MNYNIQYYNELPLRLIKRNYTGYKAFRFIINETNQNLWIPKKHCSEDGTIDSNIDYIIKKNYNQINIALGKKGKI
jgi:hypothetical protein